MPDFNELLAAKVMKEAPGVDQRPGQYLFNILQPAGASLAVRGKLFDPFYKEMYHADLVQWLKDHIVFNEYGDVVTVIDGNNILWEAD